MTPTYSVLLSLYDRDAIDLQKTLKQLGKALGSRKDVEFCVVYDFPEGECEVAEHVMAPFKEMCDEIGVSCKVERYPTLEEHPGTFNLRGHNNPVAVNNKLMDMAEGTNLVWVSSDMIVSPLLFDRLDLHLDDEGALETVWCSRVRDQDSMAEYCGPTRLFPMMWCVAHPHTGERHDLKLLKGFGYDDNDWMARMGLKFGSITIDMCHIAIHQTHGRVSQVGQLATGKAYSEEARSGWEASNAYMRKKWGGIPFDGETLKVGFGEVGEFVVLSIAGLQHPPEGS